LHIPSSVSVIRFAQQSIPGRPQVACCDTIFHAGMPEVAHVLLISKALQSEISNVAASIAYHANRPCASSGMIARTGSSSRIDQWRQIDRRSPIF
jgi:hypothetical protein